MTRILTKITAALAAVMMLTLTPGVPAHAAGAAYFRMTDTDGRSRFIIKLTDEAKIAHARRILSGEERDRIHVHGRIIKRPVPYNPGWSYHLNPDTIGFFEVAIEVCDSSMQYLEDHLDEAGGAFLPGGHWCPWSSRLVDEVRPS
ncbi:calmodulin-binding protein [Nonomuraea sp. NN258]|uniref:BP74-related protein n=1 Tax=Nonomuraea antri TaxID=2730852 RepID=UPI00156A4BA5|nr:calmodulin-binding protein [Nonomuraea antri]NRQ34486.1 calmodulin-binding protein [Nonomuraea antri]